MSYEPNTWQPGDTVTAAALNRIEQGLANSGAVIIANATLDGIEYITLDMTWREIHDAIQNGNIVYVKTVLQGSDDGDVISLLPIISVYVNNGYYVRVSEGSQPILTCSNMDDYPTNVPSSSGGGVK